MNDDLMTVQKLSKTFHLGGKLIHAVQSISFTLKRGEILGLGGESGCGKSTLGKLLLRLIEPTSGVVRLENQDLFSLSSKKLKPLRRHMQMIFQHPASSLNPSMTIEEILWEPFQIHGIGNPKEKNNLVGDLLSQVGLPNHFSRRLPQELSGGQKQRVAIARALTLKPKLIICDEPFSALDVSVQGQLINLMQVIQQQLGLSYILISHDLAVMRHFTHRLAIMYLGEFVELAPSSSLFAAPLHPYTQVLLSATPTLDLEKKQPFVFKGEVPGLLQQINGCPFQARCPFVSSVCQRVKPAWKEVKPNHFAACHLYA